ncbi:MAG: hypothetical protein KJ000_22750 [Pirellulaceae bacterium]|jgi:hypothetical protein|nr:hypothetical protein [Pirellulaceae bacterium]
MSIDAEPTYEHTQRGPLFLILLAAVIGVLAVAWILRAEPGAVVAMLILAGILLLVCLMFKHLTVRDEGDRLAVRYGPLPIFRRRIPYAEIAAADPDRTSWIDGWGIHWVPGRGYTYNLWGFDCVRLVVRDRVIRIGTDDVENLVAFLRNRIRERD